MSQSQPNPVHVATQQQPRSTFLDFLQAITGVFVVVYDGQHALKFTLLERQAIQHHHPHRERVLDIRRAPDIIHLKTIPMHPICNGHNMHKASPRLASPRLASPREAERTHAP